MTVQVTMQENISEDKVDECLNCGNQYILIWLKQGDDFNDFGDRHCPFCGIITDEFCIPINE